MKGYLRVFILQLIVPSIVALAGLGLVIAPTLADALQQATPAATQAPAGSPEVTGTVVATTGEDEGKNEATATQGPTPTTTPTPTSTPRSPVVEPTRLSIQGSKGDSLADIFRRGSAQVTYEAVPLSLWVDATQATSVAVFYPPVQGTGGSAKLNLSPEHCSAILDPENTSVKEARCFSLGVTSNDLPPGSYDTRIQVRVGDHALKEVPVSVKVRDNPWWVVLMVAVGVLATEFLTRWARRWKYIIHWAARRMEWLDLLSEKLEWILLPEMRDDEHAIQSAYTLVMKDLKAEVQVLIAWMKDGQAGKITLSGIPASEQQDKEKVASLKLLSERYLGVESDPTKDILVQADGLAQAFGGLRLGVEDEAEVRLKATLDRANQLYTKMAAHTAPGSDYAQLKKLYTDGKLVDAGVRASWTTAQEVAASLDVLAVDHKATAEKFRPDPPDLHVWGDIASALTANMEKIKAEILDKTLEALVALRSTTAEPPPEGKIALKQLMQQFTALTVEWEAASQAAAAANKPLQAYPTSATSVKVALSTLEAGLQALATYIEQVKPDQVSAETVVALMVKNTHAHLLESETKMAPFKEGPDLKTIMNDLEQVYKQDKRFFKLGRRLLRHYNQADENMKKSPYLKEAYRLLLEGKPLEAEIQLERYERYKGKTLGEATEEAKSTIKQGKPFEPMGHTLVNIGRRSFQEPLLNLRQMILLPGEGDRLVLVEKRQIGWVIPGVLFLVLIGITLGLGNQYLATPAAFADQNWLQRLLGSETLRWVVFPVLIIAAAALLLLAVYNTKSGKMIVNFLWDEILTEFMLHFRNALLLAFSQVLTIIVAVLLVLVAYNISGIIHTWGSPYDFITAFVWGALANRVAEPAKTGWDKIIEEAIKKP